MSDCWRSYDCLNSEGYRHLTVNHSYNFVNPETKAHTQHIERLWRKVKWNIPKADNKRHHMFGHLIKFLFRFKHTLYQKRFHEIFKNITRLYRPISTDYYPTATQGPTPPETEPAGRTDINHHHNPLTSDSNRKYVNVTNHHHHKTP
ncbi:OTU domain-containing protein 4 [Biomphalaria pfeifferi]|uniref:OTU domain-containing protein 4 n=1 Tax=Biomphalaria pfeifferi TaxID=112525 RepID=A0AAD8AV80_BIOPF|nr:OTU domain-containing protein 4 [Biomphalaria pfeifferi]